MPVIEQGGTLRDAFIQAFNVKDTLKHLEYLTKKFFQSDDFSMSYSNARTTRSMFSGYLAFTTQFDPMATDTPPRLYDHDIEIKNDGAVTLRCRNQDTPIQAFGTDIFGLSPERAASKILVSLVQNHPEQFMVLSRLRDLQAAHAAGAQPQPAVSQ